MVHPLSCRCARVKGLVSQPERCLNRSVCYCLDCRAYAHFLDRQGDMLDADGGTGIVAARPRDVVITQGHEMVSCMSLSDGGLLRWYARCCNTALGNTHRNHKVSFVALADACLRDAPPALEESFGPVQFRLNAKSARRPLVPMKERKLGAVLRTIGWLLKSQLGGRFRSNPFFDSRTGAPMSLPKVLMAAERAELRKLV
jgi:hypothetical protein